MEANGIIRGASELINIREFFQKWDPYVLDGITENDRKYTPERDIIAKELDVERPTVAELESVCGLDNFACDDEISEITILTSIPEDVDLVSVQMQKRELERREQDKKYRNGVLKKLKYSSMDEKLATALHFKRNSQEDLGEYEINLPNIVISIQVYPPMKYVKMQNNRNKIVPDLRFNVLATEKLSDLRDKISCVNDLAIAHDRSECPEVDNLPFAKDIYKSGFFYIEGVFYNDMRHPECQDYSSQIIAWAKEPGRGLGKMTSEKMEETPFFNLSVRLGQPYCYMHQGECEHLIVFTDIRLLSPDDSLDIRDYPRLTKKKRIVRTLCRTCQCSSAKWIVYNSELTPEDPCFLCDVCQKSLHYDEHGNKIGEFKAYKYFDQSASAINL